MSEIITKIQNTVDKYDMLTYGDTVAVGVSGGADSMLLLNYLLSVRDKYKLKLIVCNVEHGIRGEESLRDSEFVKAFCKDNDLDFRFLEINAPKEAQEQKMGVEEYSREKRYEFFSSVGADKIAVAHSLSDSVETMLFRVARGTSIKGLGGIPAVRDKIIRPLIELNKDEIRAYCDTNGIKYVTDSTNADNAYSRNRLRNVVIPELQKLNPSFEKAALRLMQSSAEDELFIQSYAKKLYNSASSDKGVSISDLKSCDTAVLKRIVLLILEPYGVTIDELHLSEAVNLFNNSGRLQIKGDLFLISGGGYLRAARLDGGTSAHTLSTRIIDIKDFKSLTFDYDAFCDCDKLCGAAYIRYRQEGDTVSPIGRNCTKTLKKLFNELKIPSETRDNIPLICDDKGIIAIPDITVDERVKLTDNTKSVILFRINTED